MNALRSLFGQGRGNESKKSYNYQRGMEEYAKGNVHEAFEYFKKALEENPNDACSLKMKARIILEYTERYENALANVNMALAHFPKKDKKERASALVVRSRIFQNLGKSYEARKDLDEAILLNPHDEEVYFWRGEVFIQQDDYEKAEMDFRKVIALCPVSASGYVGLGRIELAKKNFEKALALFEQAVKLCRDDAQVYGFVAECYFRLNDYEKAADNVVKAIGLDNGEGSKMAKYVMMELADVAFEVILQRLSMKILQNKDTYWCYCVGGIYQRRGEYARAIDYYERVGDVMLYNQIAECFFGLRRYRQALSYMDQYMSAFPTSVNGEDYSKRASLRLSLADFDGAERDAACAVDMGVENADDCYFLLGWIKEIRGDYEGAVRDYTAGIAVNSENLSFFYKRGNLFAQHLHRPEEAERDFKRLLEVNSKADSSSRKQYALAYFGRMEEAEDWVKQIVRNDESDSNGYFQAACFYSSRRDLRALQYLRTSLEKGFGLFVYIDYLEDMEYVRSLPEGRALIEEYRAKLAEKVEGEVVARRLAKETLEVLFTREGKLCKVGCKVNGLPLHFVFDTGASSVSISTLEATFMLKNGYLSQEDIRGRQNYMTADGSISEGVVVNLRRIEFGTLVLENVVATVVGSQNAPLLLGQSVLGRLGKIEIDNERQVLRITPWEDETR